MESRKNQDKHEEKDMEEILSKAEQFFEKHQKNHLLFAHSNLGDSSHLVFE